MPACLSLLSDSTDAFAGQTLQINRLGTDQRSQVVGHVVANVEINRNPEQRRELIFKVCDIEQ